MGGGGNVKPPSLYLSLSLSLHFLNRVRLILSSFCSLTKSGLLHQVWKDSSTLSIFKALAICLICILHHAYHKPYHSKTWPHFVHSCLTNPSIYAVSVHLSICSAAHVYRHLSHKKNTCTFLKCFCVHWNKEMISRCVLADTCVFLALLSCYSLRY